MAFSDFEFKVQVDVDNSELWNWCGEHYELGTWGKMFGVTGTHATYCFQNEGDAMLFLLRWPTA